MNTDQTMEAKLGKLEKLAIPDIDVHDKIMRRINLTHKEKRYNFTFKTVALASVLLIALVGSGYAYFNSISLFNDKGEQTLSIKAFDQDNKPSVVYTEAEWDAALDRVAPGMAVAIYKQDNNPERIVAIMEKPLHVTNWEELRRQAGPKFALPLLISGAVEFMEGSVQHHVGEPDVARLHEQSIANGGQLASLPVDVKGDISGVTIRALVGGESLSATLTEAKRWGTFYTDLSAMSNIGKVNIKGREGLVSTSGGRTELVWKSGTGETGVFYRISAESDSADTQAKLTAMLEWLLHGE